MQAQYQVLKTGGRHAKHAGQTFGFRPVTVRRTIKAQRGAGQGCAPPSGNRLMRLDDDPNRITLFACAPTSAAYSSSYRLIRAAMLPWRLRFRGAPVV